MLRIRKFWYGTLVVFIYGHMWRNWVFFCHIWKKIFSCNITLDHTGPIHGNPFYLIFSRYVNLFEYIGPFTMSLIFFFYLLRIEWMVYTGQLVLCRLWNDEYQWALSTSLHTLHFKKRNCNKYFLRRHFHFTKIWNCLNLTEVM